MCRRGIEMFKKCSKSSLIVGILLDLIICVITLRGASTHINNMTAEVFWNGMLILSGVVLGLDIRGLIDKQFEE